MMIGKQQTVAKAGKGGRRSVLHLVSGLSLVLPLMKFFFSCLLNSIVNWQGFKGINQWRTRTGGGLHSSPAGEKRRVLL